MQKSRLYFAFMVVLLFLNLSFAIAETSIDIKTDKQTYNSGETVNYNILLLQDSKEITQNVQVYFSDSLEKVKLNYTVESNKENQFQINENYASGVWKIKAEFQDKNVTRIFTIKEKQQVEFSIQDGKLIIKNIGNSHYIKTIQILIGEKVTSQTLNIAIGKTKELRLVAPDGNYDIQVTDGENTFVKKNIHLTGTGQVIGAIDEIIVSDSPLGGARDPGQEDKFFSGSRNILAFVFVGAVLGLGVLLLIEKRVRRKYQQ